MQSFLRALLSKMDAFEKLGKLINQKLSTNEKIMTDVNDLRKDKSSDSSTSDVSKKNKTSAKKIKIDSPKKQIKASVVRFPRNENNEKQKRAIPADVKKAYDFFSLNENASEKEINDAYHAKLKTYHPDNKSQNEIVQKVANQKTKETLTAYQTIKAWHNN